MSGNKSENFSLPGQFSGFALPDEAFAQAYEEAGPFCRALIKQNLAQLYKIYVSGQAGLRESSRQDFSRSFSVLAQREPLAWGAVVLGQGYASPAKLSAALMPMLCAKVDQVCVISLKSGPVWPKEILAAMELAGVEHGLSLTPWDCALLVNNLQSALGQGCLVYLGPHEQGGELSSLLAASGARFVQPVEGKGLGIYAEKDSGFNFESLLMAHPEAEFTLYGSARKPGLENFLKRKGGFEALRKKRFDALYVPAELAEPSLELANLVLCPGQEGSWFWPELPLELFYQRRLALGV